ncbi:MAG: copper resistance protein NlpE [Bacteroidales bacterium]|jgi:uncharacterized lipoprotein NlpE involved in copper resistance|nr:copper resistance protein NlpE [Bacteroidales bacterium]
MKKNIYTTSIIVTLLLVLTSCKFNQNEVIDAAHNSRNSLDWAGTYIGILPCADCEGIKNQVTLNTDETYELSYLFIGKSDTPFVTSGTFKWNDAGSQITLQDEGFPIRYKVGEGKLFQLDIDGNPITGELANMYILTKIAP